jgi:hypothetical protein
VSGAPARTLRSARPFRPRSPESDGTSVRSRRRPRPRHARAAPRRARTSRRHGELAQRRRQDSLQRVSPSPGAALAPRGPARSAARAPDRAPAHLARPHGVAPPRPTDRGRGDTSSGPTRTLSLRSLCPSTTGPRLTSTPRVATPRSRRGSPRRRTPPPPPARALQAVLTQHVRGQSRFTQKMIQYEYERLAGIPHAFKDHDPWQASPASAARRPAPETQRPSPETAACTAAPGALRACLLARARRATWLQGHGAARGLSARARHRQGCWGEGGPHLSGPDPFAGIPGGSIPPPPPLVLSGHAASLTPY